MVDSEHQVGSRHIAVEFLRRVSVLCYAVLPADINTI